MTTQNEIQNRNGNGHKGNVNSVVKIVGQTQLPQEFITVGDTFEDALGRCTIIDQKQRSAITFYKDHLDMFKTTKEKRVPSLTNWLNSSSAVGGINKSLSAMTYTGIYVPEGAGIKLSKQGSKEYVDAQKRVDEQQKREKDNDNHNH